MPSPLRRAPSVLASSDVFQKTHTSIAIFHATLKTFARSKGQSSTAAAAYRAAARVPDDLTGIIHDYRRRAGVDHVQLFVPKDAPAWATDMVALFNAAERAERVNGCVARELEIALPHELNEPQRNELVADLARLLVDRFGVGVLACIHAPSEKGDARAWHVHLLFTTRVLGSDGLGDKTRVLDDRKTGRPAVQQLRADVASLLNRHLAKAGSAERVDHRSLRAQAAEATAQGDKDRAKRLTRTPAKSDGPALTAVRRRLAARGHAGATWNVPTEGDQIMFRDFLAPLLGRAAERASHPSALRPLRPTRAPGRVVAPSRRSDAAAAHRGTRVFTRDKAIVEEARRARRQNRDRDRALRRYLEMLDREAARLSKQSKQALAEYARATRRTMDDLVALARHAERDERCARLLDEWLAARRRRRELEDGMVTQRKAHGEAMVEHAQAAAAVEQGADEPKPAVWQPRRRRDWAERRRKERARLAQAQVSERHVARTTGERAQAQHTAAVREAEQAMARIEAERQAAFPLPSDGGASADLAFETDGANPDAEGSRHRPRPTPDPLPTPEARRSRPRV